MRKLRSDITREGLARTPHRAFMRAMGLDDAVIQKPMIGVDHQIGRGPEFHAKACELSLEGIVSKRADAPYEPGNRGLWVKVKCLNREEFVVVGWTDPEGSRPFLGALLLAFYTPDGRLVYAGRSGGGINNAELERLWKRVQPLSSPNMPLDVPPPRTSRFGSPLVLSRVHWVRPELVVEVKYLSWTGDNLLRQVIYQGLREDKPPTEVRRPVPHPKSSAAPEVHKSTSISGHRTRKSVSGSKPAVTTFAPTSGSPFLPITSRRLGDHGDRRRPAMVCITAGLAQYFEADFCELPSRTTPCLNETGLSMRYCRNSFAKVRSRMAAQLVGIVRRLSPHRLTQPADLPERGRRTHGLLWLSICVAMRNCRPAPAGVAEYDDPMTGIFCARFPPTTMQSRAGSADPDREASALIASIPVTPAKWRLKLQAMGYEAWFYEPAAGGQGYGKDNKEPAAFTALGYNFLRLAIGWE